MPEMGLQNLQKIVQNLQKHVLPPWRKSFFDEKMQYSQRKYLSLPKN